MSTTPYKRIGNNLEKNQNTKENKAKKIYEKTIKIIANETKSHVTHKNNNTKNYNAINFNTGIKKLSLEKKNSKAYFKSIFTKDIYKESNLLDFISLLYKSGYNINSTNNTNNTSSKSSKSNTNSISNITNTNSITNTNNKNIRIVCHSGLMQKFLDKIIDRSNTKIRNQVSKLEDIYDQNLWSIFLKTENNYISITRHAYTFANFLKSKSGSLKFGSFEETGTKIRTKLEQTREKDTALSLYGIFTSLKQGKDLFNYEKSKNNIQNYSYTIFVSVLIRTWMTAICLYLPNFSTENKNENFSLYVSPFIKESGSTLDNTPDTIENQMKNIYEFIYFFTRRDNNKSTFIDKILHSLNDDVIKNNIEKISTYFKSGKKLDIFIPEKDLKYTFFYEKDKLTNEVTIMKKNIFSDNKSNKINELNIKNISIFEGKEKLSKDFLEKISRWCEPFSKKNTFFAKMSTTGKTCESRIKETPNEVSF